MVPLILRVVVEEGVVDVPLTPETTCRDVIECVRDPGEEHCMLVHTWGNTHRALSEGDRPLEILHKWGPARDHVIFTLKYTFLKQKEQFLLKIKEEATKRLQRFVDEKPEYKNLLKKMIVDGLCLIGEKDVKIKCRKQDRNAIIDLIQNAVSDYQKLSRIKVNLSVDKINHLPENGLGGVVLESVNGKISVNNELKKRLDDIVTKFEPILSNILKLSL